MGIDDIREEAKRQAEDHDGEIVASEEGEGTDEHVVAEGEEADPLEVLLSATPVRQTRKLTIRKRDGLPNDLTITLGSLTDAEFKSIGEQAEVPVKGKKGEKETDNNLFLRLIVAQAIKQPNFNDSKVLSAHGAISGDQVVQRVFLTGEIARIAEHVMSLSGWDEDAVEVAGE